MVVKKGHHFGKADAGSGRGFNDPGIDHFKKEKSIWKEIKQNLGDNKDESIDGPATVIFKQEEMQLSLFGIGEEFKKIFTAAYDRCKIISDKDDAKKFYEKGKELLNNNRIPVFIARDFNTTGLNGDPFDGKSNFYRLLIAEGSSAETGRGGGSHGHGQKAPFARSDLRTVYYYSYVEKGISNTNHKDLFIGKTVLNEWIDDNNKRRQHAGYYGNIDKDLLIKYDQPIPLFGDEIPKELRRSEGQTGLDIYILGSNMTKQWKHSAIIQSLNNFYAAIEHGLLKVGLQKGRAIEYIDKNTIDDYVAEKRSNVGYYLKALREPVNGKPFEREIKHLGNVKLFISIHEGGTQKVELMRRPRMKITQYDKPTLSNYSGVMIVDDKTGNRNMRMLEDPEHKKLERFRAIDAFGENVKIIKDLENYVDDTLTSLRQEQSKQPFTLPGLGKIFPDVETENNEGENEGDNREKDKNKIPEDLVVNISDKITMTSRNLPTRLKLGIGAGGFGGGSGGSGDGKGGGQGGSGGNDEGGGVISSKDIKIRTHHSGVYKTFQKYRSVISVKKDCDGWVGYIAFGIDNVKERINISEFKYEEKYEHMEMPEINNNRIKFGKLKASTKFSFTFITDLKVKSALITEG